MSPNIEYYNLNIIKDQTIGCCDAVTLIEVFEHIPLEYCDDFVGALSKITNENGLIFLTVPHKNVPVSYKHFQHFDKEGLISYFGDKFDFIDVKYIQSNSIFMKIFSRLINNKLFVIKSDLINNLYYKFYKKHHFYSSESRCERIYAVLRKK